jgi:hypothetical protein
VSLSDRMPVLHMILLFFLVFSACPQAGGHERRIWRQQDDGDVVVVVLSPYPPLRAGQSVGPRYDALSTGVCLAVMPVYYRWNGAHTDTAYCLFTSRTLSPFLDVSRMMCGPDSFTFARFGHGMASITETRVKRVCAWLLCLVYKAAED